MSRILVGRRLGGALPRVEVLRVAFVVVVLSVSLVLRSVGGAAAATPTTFAGGSLIIPMDTDTSGNHSSYNQNLGMWKAYGLVFKLLQSGIPVNWAISPTKVSTADVDFSVSSVHDKRTGTDLGSWNYRGGPFVIDSAYAAQAMPIITTWWAANGNLPNVHEAEAGFSATIPTVLTTAPRIANEAENIGVTAAYYNAAGITDSNGNPWSSTSPNVVGESQIAAGALFTQGATCAQPKYDIFVTPHNEGYSYSLTDPTNLGTKTYAQLDTFVQEGGGWTALCHSILSNENAIAALTTNGTASVKALFKTSQPGGQPGGFLTTAGFPDIDNTGGTWSVLSPSLPTAQGVPTSVAQSLPGGSVQTWPAPGHSGAPTYYSDTSRVATFTASGVSHDDIITGIYHNGTGAGRVTYIGGHSFTATLPYSTNADAPFLRAFYNSLLMNGSGTAKLDVSLSPGSYPQNGTGLLNVRIKNVGAETATNVANAGITLASGFTYVGTTSGPAPTVSGQTLVWPGGLGDVAGNSTAVTFQVSVGPSVSSTLGSKHLGTFSATFTDQYGSTFTAGVCKDVTITPVPVPTLSKTPSSQGPVHPGFPVTWTLSYGDAGGAALSSGSVQDTLPAGYVYVSSSSSPSLGAPTVIPGSQTIVRWSAGTVAAGGSGTITIIARAGAITNATGSPPSQTFTNNAVLTGTDAGGTSYSASASATVSETPLDISLDKSVDHTFLSSLPGSATYTMTPHIGDNTALSNVRVIDPLPTGIAAAPTVGQGGTYGAYSPSAAVGGSSGGLTTAITVSSNEVKSGTPVTVTLNVSDTSAVTGVFADPMSATGGAFTCSSPSPASANVPAGGSGVNFTSSCTTDGLGEYVFSDNATDGGSHTWPSASSASVLSTAGGGPNVALWNLGSNTAAVAGQTTSSSYTGGIFGMRGDGGPGSTTTTFDRYSTSGNSWTALSLLPVDANQGGALTTDGAGTIYALPGNNTQAFYAYNAVTDTWATEATTGANVKEGGSLVFLNVSGTKYVFATMGNTTNAFKRYDIAGNTWSAMTPVPVNLFNGATLSTDGTNIYLVVANNTNTFYRYNVAANTWTQLANLPQPVNVGGGSVYLGGYIYAFQANTQAGFYRYSISGNTWSAMTNAPGNVQNGGALTTDGTYLYAFEGNNTTAFWRYAPSGNSWTTLAVYPAQEKMGAALTYMPTGTGQTLNSSIAVTRSLGVTGDTVDVTLSLTANPTVSSVTSGTLTVTPTGGASCSNLTSPTLTSADSTSTGVGDPVTYQWTCTLAAGSSPGSLTFSDSTVTGSGPVTFPAATAMSVLVTPPLTMQVTVPNGAPNPVQDTSLMLTGAGSAASPTVSTYSGPPAFTLTKASSVDSATPLQPGDQVTYTMTVQNTGTGNASNVVISDPIPAQATYVGCAGGSSCSNSSGTVTWNVGALSPGDTTSVTLTVAMRTDLAISDPGYAVSNAASVTSTEVPTPTSSNTVTNTLAVRPAVVKTVSAWNAGNGDPLTYTVTVSNPGAAFTTDVTDPLPTGTSFAGTGTCTPACTFSGGSVTWSGASVPPGLTTFTFGVTITATGGATITNTATVDPTSPNLAPIPSNDVETNVGPSLELVKLADKTGLVSKDDVITYTMLAVNESAVPATGAIVSDPLPPGTSYVAGSCSTPAGTSCSYSSGEVDWTLGAVGANASIPLGFQARVGTGVSQVTNTATITATNSPTPTDSNQVDNGIVTYPLTVSVAAGQGTVISDSGGITCDDTGGTCSASYDSGTLVRLTATGRNGQQFTGWSGDCSGSSPSCQVTMNQARNVQASFASPPAAPDLVVVKSHTGDFAQGGTGSYTLTVSNIGGTPTSGSVSVADNAPTGLTVTGISGTGWTCDVPTATCSRTDALDGGQSYPDVTVAVDVAPDAPETVTNQATVSGGGETNTSNDSASDGTNVTPTPVWPLTVSIEAGQGTVTADSGGVSCNDAGGTCSASYNAGTVVNLTAAGRNGQQFTGWSGQCSGSSPSCQVTMDQARNVEASFATPPADPDLVIVKSHIGDFEQRGTGSYTLTVSNIGGVATSDTVSVVDDAPASLTITDLSGTGWTCDVPSATCTRTDALDAGTSYPAITVSVSVARNAPGSVTNDATVSGGGETVTDNDSASDQTTITPLPTWPLTVTVSGSGSGTVGADTGGIGCSEAGGTCSASYDDGTLVTLTAAPGAHSSFAGWGGACTGGDFTCQVTMDQASDVTAAFTLFQPDLTIAKTHNGDFTQGGTGTYTLSVSNIGADPSYGEVTAVDDPPAELVVTGMSGDGWTCDVPSATCSRADSLAGGGSFPDITVDVSVAGDAGSPVTNAATVSGGGDVDVANNSASDPTTIDPQQFPLTVSVTGSGSVDADSGAVSGCTDSSGTCSDSYDNGTVVTLTATPGANSNFAGWGGACSGTDLTCQVTMDQARDATADFTPFQPDLTIVKTHVGDFTQGESGSYHLSVSNLGSDPTFGTVTVVDNPPAAEAVTALSGDGWSCDLPTVTCTRTDALAGGQSYPDITIEVQVADDADLSLTNSATVSGGGDVNGSNNDASDPTTIVTEQFPLNVEVAGSGTVDADSGAISRCTASGGVCVGEYDNGTVVTLTETPGAHSNFAGWGGACSGIGTTCQVTMDQARNVTAAFTLFQPDLTIAKTHTGDFTQGGTGSYTLLVSNVGADPSYGEVDVLDNPPAEETVTGLSGNGWSCDLPSLTCMRTDDLAAGTSFPEITVDVSVDGNAGSPVTNSATVSGGGDTNLSNDSAADPTTIDRQQFPLDVTVAGPGSVDADSGAVSGCTSAGGTCSGSYDNGTAVTLTETPDAHSTFTGWGGACSGTAATCHVTMDQARSVTASFVLFQPDLTVAKSHAGDFTQGGTGSYTLLVSNLGADPSYGEVDVVDTAPAGLTVTGLSGTGWTCDTPSATCSRSDAVAGSDSFPAITVDVSVDGNASSPLTNSATVSGGGDVNLSNNHASDPTTIDPQQFPLNVSIAAGQGTIAANSGGINCDDTGGTCSAGYDNGTVVTLAAAGRNGQEFTGWSGDCSGSSPTCQVTMDQAHSVAASFAVPPGGPDLVLVKTHTGDFQQGGTGSYTLTASNTGDTPTSGTVTVVDTPPAGLTITGMTGSGWTCTPLGGTCSRGDALAAATSFPSIEVDVSVARNAASDLTNTAAVSGGGETNTGNDSAGDETTIDPLPTWPLSVSVSGSGSGSVGSDVGGIGCSDAGGTCGATYDDGTVVTLTETPGTGSFFTGWIGACSGASTTCQVTMNAARDVTASFALFQPDLTIVKSHSGDFTQGGTGSYTLTVSNAAGDPSYGGVTVVDDPPASLTVTGMSGTGWTCDVPTTTCSRSDALAPSTSFPPITVDASVAGNAPANVTNHATVSGGGDTNLLNDSASDPTVVHPQQFPLNVTVAGAGSVDADSGAISGCTSSGGACSDGYDNGTLVSLTETPGSHSNFTGWSGACSGSASTCQVTMDQARNVTASFAVFQPDLTIAKSHSGVFTQAGTGSYTLTASNLGVDPTFGEIDVVDNPPAAETVTGLSGTGWTCDLPSLTCSRSDALAASASFPPITVDVSVAGDAPTNVTNHATVSGGGDVNPANNTASDPTVVHAQQFPLNVTVAGSGSVDADSGAISGCTGSGGTCSDTYDNGTLVTLTEAPGTHSNFTGWSGACSGTAATCHVTMDQARNVTATFTDFQPDLTIVKSHTGDFAQGGTGSYTLAVSNMGVDPSYGEVDVVDNPPSAETITNLSGTGWTCDVPSATCTRSDALAPSASYPAITVAVAVAADAPANVTNQASVSGGGDIDGANNTSSDPTTVDSQQYPLTVSVHGSGSVGADAGAVSDCTDSSGTCADTYDSGTLVTLTATAGANSIFTGWGGACSGSATTCHVTMSQVRNVTATFVAVQPDLTVTKTHTGTFAQGGTGTYTLTVSNAGTSASYGNVWVTDVAPTGLSVTGMSGTGWTCSVSTATCSRADTVAAGASFPAVTVTVAVGASAPSSVTNSATVSGGGDANLSNNTASDPTTIAAQTFPLTVTVNGNGSGSVGADRGAIAGCTASGGVCSASYANGTLVTLTATPGSQSTFTGWGGACSGTAPTCQVTMSQARNVTATFAKTAADTTPGGGCTSACQTYPLHVTLAGTGTGRAQSAPTGISCGTDCSQSYAAGTVVTLVASPGPSSVFEGFKGCDSVSGTRCTVRLSRARNVVVTFGRPAKVKVAVAGRVSRAVLRPGTRLFDRLTVRGLGTRPGTLLLRLYGPFATRAAIRCSGKPAWSTRISVHDGAQASPLFAVPKPGFYSYQASLGTVTTACGVAAETALGAPRIITGGFDIPRYVPAHGAGGATPTSVTIGSVGIDAPIGPIGIDLSRGALGTPTDIRRTGWWTDGAAPGATAGVVLVAGHVDSAAAGPGALFFLGHSHVGNLVRIRARNGRTFAYRIVSVHLYLKAALPTSVWSRTGRPRLVLVTCGGPFDPAIGHYRDNVVVTAVPVSG